MPTKTGVAIILISVLTFGAIISGCQRKRGARDPGHNTASMPRRSGKKSAKRYDVASARPIRPAEVLSASAYRPQLRRQNTQPAARRPSGQPYNYTQAYNKSPAFTPIPSTAPAQHGGFSPMQPPTPRNYPAQRNGFSPVQPRQSRPYAASRPVSAPYTSEFVPRPGVPAYQSGQPAPQSFVPVIQPAYTPSYQQTTGYQQYEPLPEPIPLSYPVRAQSPDLVMAQTQLDPNQYAQPVQESAPWIPSSQPQAFTIEPPSPAALDPFPVVSSHSSARREFESAPPYAVPAITPGQFAIPLPELEPVQYQRAEPMLDPIDRRVVPMVPSLPTSARQADGHGQSARAKTRQPDKRGMPARQSERRFEDERRAEIERALAPLHSATPGRYDGLPAGLETAMSR